MRDGQAFIDLLLSPWLFYLLEKQEMLARGRRQTTQQSRRIFVNRLANQTTRNFIYIYIERERFYIYIYEIFDSISHRILIVKLETHGP